MHWMPALLNATPENVERLARRLGAPIPALRDGWARHRVLCRDVCEAIEKDRIMAAAEERRQAERAEQKRIAREIAATLGETGPRPRRQIERIVGLMGEEWTRQQLSETLCAVGYAATPINTRGDGLPRTLGGSFFVIARDAASGGVRTGVIDRREFFRCFFDHPRKPRKPAAPRPVPVRRVEAPVRQAQGKPRKQTTVPEVFVQRRRA